MGRIVIGKSRVGAHEGREGRDGSRRRASFSSSVVATIGAAATETAMSRGEQAVDSCALRPPCADRGVHECTRRHRASLMDAGPRRRGWLTRDDEGMQRVSWTDMPPDAPVGRA